MSTEPKYLHPSVTSKIIDNAVTVLTASGLNNMFVALEAEKGAPNEAMYITSESEFIFNLGEPNYSKWGQAGMNAVNWLRAGGGLWAIRVVPDDETFASLSLGIAYNDSETYTNDEEEYAALKMTADQIKLWNAKVESDDLKYAKGSATGATVTMEKFYAGKVREDGTFDIQSKLGTMTADAIRVYNASMGYDEESAEALKPMAVKKEIVERFGLKVSGNLVFKSSLTALIDANSKASGESIASKYTTASVGSYKAIKPTTEGIDKVLREEAGYPLNAKYASFEEAWTAAKALADSTVNPITVIYLEYNYSTGYVDWFYKADLAKLKTAFDATQESKVAGKDTFNMPYKGAFVYEVSKESGFSAAITAATGDLGADAVTAADKIKIVTLDSTTDPYYYGPCYESTYDDVVDAFKKLEVTATNLSIEKISSSAEWQYCYEVFYADGAPVPSSVIKTPAMTENYMRWYNHNVDAYKQVKKSSDSAEPSTGVYEKVKTYFVTNASNGETVWGFSMTEDAIEIFNTTKAATRAEVTSNGEVTDDIYLTSQTTESYTIFNNTAKVAVEVSNENEKNLKALAYLAPLFKITSEDSDKEGYSNVTFALSASDTFGPEVLRKLKSTYAVAIEEVKNSTANSTEGNETEGSTENSTEGSNKYGFKASISADVLPKDLVAIGLYDESGALITAATFEVKAEVPSTIAKVLMPEENAIALENTYTPDYVVNVWNVIPSVSYAFVSSNTYTLNLAVSFYAVESVANLIKLNDLTETITMTASSISEYVTSKKYNVVYEDSINEPNPLYVENVYQAIGFCATTFTNRAQDNINHEEIDKTDCKTGYIVTETRDDIDTVDKADMRLTNTKFVEVIRFLPKGSGPWYNNLAVSLSYESGYDDTYPEWSMFTLEVIEKFNGAEIVRESFDVALDPDAISNTKDSLYIVDVVNRYSSYLTCVTNYDNLQNFIETKMKIADVDGNDVKDVDGNVIVPTVDKVVKFIFNQITLDELNKSIFGEDYATGDYAQYAYTDIMSAIGYDDELCHLDTTLTDSTGEVIYNDPFVSSYYFSTVDTNASFYLGGGSRGNGWGHEYIDETTDEVRSTSTLTQALKRAYNGTTDPIVTNTQTCVFDIMLDANYDITVKNAMSDLAALTRNDCITILDMNMDCANASQAVAKRKEQMQYNTYYTSIFSQHLRIDDEWTGKPVKVTPTWFLATKIPQNDSAYTEIFNFVGPRRGIIAGFRDVSWLPTEPEKTELYKNQVNYIEQDTQATMFATENTSQKLTSPLSMIHAVRSLLKLKREMEAASRNYRMEFSTDDNMGLLQQDLNNIANNKVLAGGYEYISPVVSASAYDKQQKICRVKVDLAFTDIMERFVFEFVVNRAS